MKLEFNSVYEDKRGKILFLSWGKKNFNIVEIKKGFARGGHYHNFPSKHYLLSGKIQYRENNLNTKKETIKIISAPATISVMPNVAHLLIAIDDSIFVEIFDSDYDAINYLSYRKIVEKLMYAN